MKDFARDDSAWADFLISKAALILASIILFAALFHLVAGFEDLEAQEQLDSLARDFKNAVDETGARNFQEESQQEFQGEFQESSYCFEEKELFRDSPFGGDLKIRVSGEYVYLEIEADGKSFSAVRPFAFRVLPFNESVLQENLRIRFGAEGSRESPIIADYREVEAFLQVLGTKEAVLNPGKNISLNKELIYVKDQEGASAFVYILIFQ
ncbi:MAG: hypothetical protein NHB15_15150 [Methanosarcina barkeri]|nr:hypothetical protein [Methanosarcina sp. ERenArc_MAG2]